MNIKELNEQLETRLYETVTCSPEVNQLYRELVKDLHPDKSHNNDIGKFLNRAREEDNLRVLKFIKDNKDDLEYTVDVLSGKRPLKASTTGDNGADLDLSAIDLVNQHKENIDPLTQLKQREETNPSRFDVFTGIHDKRLFKANLSALQLIDLLNDYVESASAQNKVSYNTLKEFVRTALAFSPKFRIQLHK